MSEFDLDNLLSGNRRALAKAITLVESKLDTHREQAQDILEQVLPLSGNSIRIGITGVPGVGKSTFIEAFGLYLIEQGKRVAVLAVDLDADGLIVGVRCLDRLRQSVNVGIDARIVNLETRLHGILVTHITHAQGCC